MMDAAVVIHLESPSQKSRHRVRSACPRGVNLAPCFSSHIQEEWQKIGLVEKYCNMLIIEKIDYSVGQNYKWVRLVAGGAADRCAGSGGAGLFAASGAHAE
jgi:hypothetical protein